MLIQSISGTSERRIAATIRYEQVQKGDIHVNTPPSLSPMDRRAGPSPRVQSLEGASGFFPPEGWPDPRGPLCDWTYPTSFRYRAHWHGSQRWGADGGWRVAYLLAGCRRSEVMVRGTRGHR